MAFPDTPFSTLFGFSLRSQSDIADGSIVAFGAPLQSSAPRRPGTDAGPSAIREISCDLLQPYLASPSRTAVDLSSNRAKRLRDFGASSDLGDLPCEGPVSTIDIERVAQLTAAIVAAGAFPILLGGDHRVFEGLVRGVRAAAGAPAILSVSDKITLPPATDAAPLPLAGLASATADPSPVLCVGVNSLQSAASWDGLHAVGGAVISADALHETRPQAVEKINSFIAKNEPCVCGVDLEVVDSGHAAGTPSVNVGGATPEQLIDLLSEIDISAPLAGIAITNVAPKLDARGLTELAAAKALLALLDNQLFTEAAP